MTKKTKAQQIKKLERQVEHWSDRYYEAVREKDAEIKPLKNRFDQERYELNNERSKLAHMSGLWNQWTLINKGDGDDPDGTIRLPRGALAELLVLLRP